MLRPCTDIVATMEAKNAFAAKELNKWRTLAIPATSRSDRHRCTLHKRRRPPTVACGHVGLVSSVSNTGEQRTVTIASLPFALGVNAQVQTTLPPDGPNTRP